MKFEISSGNESEYRMLSDRNSGWVKWQLIKSRGVLEMWTCVDCNKEIKPPLGKPFSNGDGKTRCAACATDFYMKSPLARVKLIKPYPGLSHWIQKCDE